MTIKDRKQLGQFLKTRRARLSPTQVGLPTGQRRRTPGLRREEVAQLAGVSVTWYTWIEQGRDISFSMEVLESLARVLQLTPSETQYLITLAGKQPTPQTNSPISEVNPTLQQILDHQADYPAYLMGRYWEVLAWNQAAQALFGEFATMPKMERNMVWYTLVRAETRTLVVDWENRAQRLLAEFRADCSDGLTDPWFVTFIEQLKQHSPEFVAWWAQHLVYPRDGGRRDFNHPYVGRLALTQTTFRLSHHPALKMVIHVPLAEFDSAAKLKALLTD